MHHAFSLGDAYAHFHTDCSTLHPASRQLKSNPLLQVTREWRRRFPKQSLRCSDITIFGPMLNYRIFSVLQILNELAIWRRKGLFITFIMCLLLNLRVRSKIRWWKTSAALGSPADSLYLTLIFQTLEGLSMMQNSGACYL